MILAFTIPGEPVHAARPRAVSIGGHARIYSPKQNVVSKQVIMDFASKAMNGSPPLEGPIKLHIEATYPHPGSWSKPKRERTPWKISKPDWDNIGKLAADALTGIVFRDDAQVVQASVIKRYSVIPCTLITVEVLA